MMITFAPEQLVGQTINGFQVETLLHQDRVSAVYRARHLLKRNVVQLTLFRPPDSARQQYLARFMSEAAKIQAIQHPNLLSVYEYGEQNGFPYLMTPSLTQKPVAMLLQQQGRCPPATTLRIFTQVVAGLEYAHQYGMIHRALNPIYILIQTDQSVKVAGLGFMNLLEKRGILPENGPYAHLLTVADTMLTTPRYLAPECLSGQVGDVRSDVYALGTILFEMLSATPLYRDELSLAALSQRQKLPPALHHQYDDIPPAVDHVLQRMLAYDPALRFQRASDFLNAFQHVLQESNSGKLYLATSRQTGYHSVPDKCSTCPVGQAAGQMNSLPAQDRRSEVRGYDTSAPLPAYTRSSRRARQSYSRHPRRVSRRGVLALGLVGAGVVIGAGILGLEHMNLAQLANRGMIQTPSATASKVIGHTNQGRNTAIAFTNPRDQQSSLLIRLPNGNFVAYKKACTHEGVAVYYDEKRHLLVCPAHGSIFDPAHNGRVVQGPAPSPLPEVTISPQKNGTITTA